MLGMTNDHRIIAQAEILHHLEDLLNLAYDTAIPRPRHGNVMAPSNARRVCRVPTQLGTQGVSQHRLQTVSVSGHHLVWCGLKGMLWIET